MVLAQKIERLWLLFDVRFHFGIELFDGLDGLLLVGFRCRVCLAGVAQGGHFVSPVQRLIVVAHGMRRLCRA